MSCFCHACYPDKETNSYYDDNGILLVAMDDKDADRVTKLIPNATLYSGFESMHDIHEINLMSLFKFFRYEKLTRGRLRFI